MGSHGGLFIFVVPERQTALGLGTLGFLGCLLQAGAGRCCALCRARGWVLASIMAIVTFK